VVIPELPQQPAQRRSASSETVCEIGTAGVAADAPIGRLALGSPDWLAPASSSVSPRRTAKAAIAKPKRTNKTPRARMFRLATVQYSNPAAPRFACNSLTGQGKQPLRNQNWRDCVRRALLCRAHGPRSGGPTGAAPRNDHLSHSALRHAQEADGRHGSVRERQRLLMPAELARKMRATLNGEFHRRRPPRLSLR
jgi:hypothetical protein